MEQSIREVTGEEAKLLALQFLGQNLGEMKELDKNIVSSLKPIANTINPNAMLQSIPQGMHISQPAPQPVIQHPAAVATTRAAEPIVIPSLVSLQPSIVNTPQQNTPNIDPNQLELNFNESPYSEQIFNKLEALERKLDKFLETQQEIINSIELLKKKSKSSQTVA